MGFFYVVLTKQAHFQDSNVRTKANNENEYLRKSKKFTRTKNAR